MNCETCKVKLPSMKTRLNRVNEALHAVGMHLYNYQSEGMAEVYRALDRNGFQDLDESATFHNYHLHQSVGEGKYLTVTIHKYESGRVEIVAYVN